VLSAVERWETIISSSHIPGRLWYMILAVYLCCDPTGNRLPVSSYFEDFRPADYSLCCATVPIDPHSRRLLTGIGTGVKNDFRVHDSFQTF